MQDGVIETIIIVGLAIFLGELIYNKFLAVTSPEAAVKEELTAKPKTVREFLEQWNG